MKCKSIYKRNVCDLAKEHEGAHFDEDTDTAWTDASLFSRVREVPAVHITARVCTKTFTRVEDRVLTVVGDHVPQQRVRDFCDRILILHEVAAEREYDQSYGVPV